MDQNTQETVQPKKDDSFLALVILVLGIIAAIGVLLYFWKNQKSSSKGKK
jgi:flagellar basal body-associated protein FliL